MPNFSLSKVVSIFFIVNFSIILFISIFSIWNQYQSLQIIKDFHKHPFTVSNTIKNLKLELEVLRDTNINLVEEKEDFNSIEKSINKNLTIISELYLGPKKDIKELYLRVNNFKHLIKDENNIQNRDIIKESYKELQNSVNTILIYALNKAHEFVNLSQKKVEESLNFIVIISLFIVSLSSLFLYFVYKRFRNSFDDILLFIKRMKSSDYKRIEINSDDFIELKNLKEALNTMAKSIKNSNLSLQNSYKELSKTSSLYREEQNRYKALSLRLQLALKVSGMGLWEWSYKDNTLIWDDKMYEIYGIKKTLNKFPYSIWSNALDIDTKKQIEDELFQIIKNKNDYNAKFWINTPNGERRYIRAFGINEFDEDANLIGMIGTNVDITEQKNLEDQIIYEKNFISSIVESANCIITVIDGSGTMIKLNKFGEQFTGYSEEEISSQPFFWKCLLPKEIQKDVLGIVKNAQKGNIEKRFDNAWLSKDGEEHIFEWSNTLVKKPDGSMDYLVAIGIDITEKEQQKEEFETIFKLSRDGLAILDLKSNFLKVNYAYCDITKLSEKELLNTSCIELTAIENKEKMKELFNQVLKIGYADNFESSYLINNNKVALNISLSLLPDKEHILINTRDITKNKLFEEQSKLASMGEMIGNIAHQWRQPLSVISTIASGIRVRDEFDQLKDYNVLDDMNMIVSQVQYLSKTIDDFRNFLKNTNVKSNINIIETINKTLSILHSSLVNNNINVILNLRDNIIFSGFENELIQALINIINNAKDAVKENIEDEDERFIFISTEKNSGFLELRIRDSGKGIDNDIIDRIFEPYFTTKHQNVGTGIGLSMAHKIITQRHKAEIKVINSEYYWEGNYYKGAEFIIKFRIK